MRFTCFYLPILFCLVAGCARKTPEQETPFQPGTPIGWAQAGPDVVALPEPDETEFIAAPAPEKTPPRVSAFSDIRTLSKNVSIKLERSWVDGNNRNMLFVLRNDTAKGTNAIFYVFTHDRLGRVISAKQETIYFQPNEAVFRQLSSPLNSKEEHWSVAVK